MATVRDIALDSDHDITVEGQDLQLVSDKAAIAQSVSIRLQLILGEWFLDTSKGLPIFTKILVKNPNPALISGLYRSEIAGTLGINSVTSLDLTFDRAARVLSGTFSADTDVGQLDGEI